MKNRGYWWISLCIFGAFYICGAGALRDQFEDFKIQFHKQYSSLQENEERFKIFQSNVERAKKLSTFSSLTEWGITKFMDLTEDEFKSKYLMKNLRQSQFTNYFNSHPIWKNPKIKTSAQFPTAFDWNTQAKVTEVNNQESCGGCWAFSATEAIESVWSIYAETNATQLSVQQVIDCDYSDEGCEGGIPFQAYQYVIQAGGLQSNSSYPFAAKDGTCKVDPSEIVAHITKWQFVTQTKNESTMQEFVFGVSPLSVCVDAGTWQLYQGGVLTADDCGQSLDHCVQVTGWRTYNNTLAWNVRNSWGQDWGEQGYIWIQYGSNVCGIADLVTVPFA